MSRTGPHRNRVTPFGEIVAIELRGAWTGNRGILHRDREIVRHHTGIAWITCVLALAEPARPPLNTAGAARRQSGDGGAGLLGVVPDRGRRIPQWETGHYTPLFFFDEAVALAAGHRPCAQCRRPAFRAFVDPLGGPRAPDLDRRLQSERWRPRRGRRLHPLPWADLPDGAFVVADGTPALVLGDGLMTWTTAGYRGAASRPTTGTACVLTPPATLAVLRAGYPVQIDAAATTLAHTRRRTAESSSSTEA